MSAKGADARRETVKRLAGSWRGALNTATVLRELLNRLAAWAAVLVCGTLLLAGQDPFAKPARARVFLFVRSDCPITNRYAPELGRIAHEFAGRQVEFWLIYPDASESEAGIERHKAEYNLPGTPLLDPGQRLAKRAEASVSPQAAVFDYAGQLVYSGRIDDRYVALGKARPAPQTHDLEAAISATLAGKSVAEARTRAVGCYLADVK